MITRRLRSSLVALGALVLAGCATVNEAPVVDLTEAPPRPRPGATSAPGDVPAAAPGTHVVAQGDTLYGIAFRHGLDFRQLAEWNRIPAPFTIRPGQTLRLTAPPASVDGVREAQRRADLASVAQDAGRAAGAADATATVSLAGPDWRDDVPPEGEARTFGIEGGGAATPVATAPSGIAPDPGASGDSRGVPAGSTRHVANATPAARGGAVDDGSTLRPAPDGAMPPPMHLPVAPAADAATPAAARPESPPATPSGALARAVGVSPAPVQAPPDRAPVAAPPVEPASPAPGAVGPTAARAAPDANLAARRADPPARVADGPTRSAGGVRWRWPADGTLVGRFAPGDPARQGIDLRGREGAPVLAAADGEVVYSGNGLVGYGELIIIKHSAEFLSAYGHNRRRLVAEGERVRAGQPIAEMGRAPNGFDALHFEIRRAGRPTDPLLFLPPR